MRRSARFRGAWLAWLLTIAVLGCGPTGPRRYRISGEVTYDGSPVPMGEISFDPVDAGMGGGFAPVVDGRFDTAIDGRGHLGGAHRVQIVGFKGWVDPADPDRGAIPMFSPYETTVELPARNGTMDFEVPASEGR